VIDNQVAQDHAREEREMRMSGLERKIREVVMVLLLMVLLGGTIRATSDDPITHTGMLSPAVVAGH
jgi:hypothetical protein